MNIPKFPWIVERQSPENPRPFDPQTTSISPILPTPLPPIPDSDVRHNEVCQELSIPIGSITLSNNESLTITNYGVYLLNCDGNITNQSDSGLLIDPGNIHGNGSTPQYDMDKYFQLRSPFYGSVAPVMYTLAGATGLAWLLLILLITSTKKRPWLQKFSTLALAALLTATLADAVKELNRQYQDGYQDSFQLQRTVMTALSFEIPGVIVQSIMWLAHIQILLRIFIRRREELLVKIVGGILWTLELIFWCIGLFTDRQNIRVTTRINRWAISAYAFEIVLVSTYATCLFIYSLRKRKYAYNDKTYIIALFSAVSLIAPLVFLGLFSSTWMIGWAVYCSLISNGAATVVLWDWLDAIEHFEKQEQRSGVMGRQVYEDEMALDIKSRIRRGSDYESHSGDNNRRDNGSVKDSQAEKKNLFKGPLKIKSRLRNPSWSAWKHMFRVGSSPASLWTDYNTTRRSQTSSVDLSGINVSNDPGETRTERGDSHVDGDADGGEVSWESNSISTHRSNSSDTSGPKLTTIVSGKNRMERFIHPVKQTGIRVSTSPTTNGYSETRNQQLSISDIEDEDSDDDDDDLYVIVHKNDEDPSQFMNPPATSSENNESHISTIPGRPNLDLDLDLYDRDDNEEPPNVFNRVPGFDPGDYWDDKAPSSSQPRH